MLMVVVGVCDLVDWVCLVVEFGLCVCVVGCDVIDVVLVDVVFVVIDVDGGWLDGLVNNVGVIELIVCLGDVDSVVWLRVLEVNVGGVYCCVCVVLFWFVVSGGGVVVNVFSGAVL